MSEHPIFSRLFSETATSFCEEDYLDLMFSADLIRLETNQEKRYLNVTSLHFAIVLITKGRHTHRVVIPLLFPETISAEFCTEAKG